MNGGRPTIESSGAASGVAGNASQSQFSGFGSKYTPKFIWVLSGNSDAKGRVGYLVTRRILVITANQLNINVIKLFPATKVVEDRIRDKAPLSFQCPSPLIGLRTVCRALEC